MSGWHRAPTPSWHIDVRAFLLDNENARLVGRTMLRILGPDVTCIGGPATSAIPLAMATITQSSQPMTAFLVRPESRQHSAAQRIEGNLGPRVAIIDDACTTDTYILHAIRAVEAAGATVLQVATLFDQGGGQIVVAAGYSYQNLITITNHQPTPDTSGPPAPSSW